MSVLPEIWKNRDVYSVADAARLWAHAVAGMPLNCEPNELIKWQNELALARKDLWDNVPVQKGIAPPAPERPAHEVARLQVLALCEATDPKWGILRTEEFPPIPGCEWTFFHGRDLAAYAAERGKPGLFGFDEPAAPALIDDAVPEDKGVMMTPNGKREVTDMERTLYQVIRALALALAETDPNKLKKNERAWEGYSNASGDAGIVGHLRKNGFTKRSGETLRQHIKKALDNN